MRLFKVLSVISYPTTQTATPLIIVGPQRSGTRFVTNVLNSVPGVVVQDEIPDSIMMNVLELISKCEKKYESADREYTVENWENTKHDFMFSVWSNLTQGKRKKTDKKCIFYGYKTPFHEVYFDFYNQFFYPVRPKYICCVRNFLGHYFSVHARWPKRSFVWIARRYVRSLRQLRYMKKKRPEDVFFFFLDDYKQEGTIYLQKKIFDPLGLEDTDLAVKKAEKGPVNASIQLGLKKKDSLTLLQSWILQVYSSPFQYFECLHHDFG